MYTFGRVENVPFLLDEVDVLEVAITPGLNAQNAAGRSAIEIRADVGASKKEMARHDEVITARRAEGQKHVVAFREEGRDRVEKLRRNLADVKHELAVIKSPVLILPDEVVAEIFNWYMLMGGSLAAVLLVCKWWITVAYSSPRLWSRIAVTDRGRAQLRLQGAIRCTTLNYLHSALSHARSSPLQIELSLGSYAILDSTNNSSPSSSLLLGPQVSSNRIEAINLIFSNHTLKRCTFLILGSSFIAPELQIPLRMVEEMTGLSWLVIDRGLDIKKIHFVRSLIKLSPSLRHIRCDTWYFGLQGIELEVRVKRIESYGWIFPYTPCLLFDESPSLRELGIDGSTKIPLTLPALQVLRWTNPKYYRMHFITAPHLHTIIIHHSHITAERLSPGSVNLPNLRVSIHIFLPDLATLRGFQTPALEHLSIQSPNPSPTGLFELFDGSTHMPTPKSLHLECTFTDAALIAVLGRLPWLEELQVAGSIAQDVFWESLTPSNDQTWRVLLPNSYSDERAIQILVPSLKVLLVNYSKVLMYTPPKGNEVPRSPRTEITKASELRLKGGEWTVMQASAVAIARERAGCALETLACWSPEQEVKVLIGSLETLPQRPK